ncbi:MAG: transposase [Myxococcales bacterium]|nr:transposase [Myxococcales bacterium]
MGILHVAPPVLRAPAQGQEHFAIKRGLTAKSREPTQARGGGYIFFIDRNSMIESFWKAMKHNWCFLHSIDRSTTLRKLVEFYVKEYNQVLPHSAFQGQTPDEMYFGTGEHIPDQLEEAADLAREARIKAHRS